MDIEVDGPDRLTFSSRTTAVDAPNTRCAPTLNVRIGDEDRLSLPRAAANRATLAISGALLLAMGMASTWIIASILDRPTHPPTLLTSTKLPSPVDVSKSSKGERLEGPSLPMGRASEIRQLDSFEKTSTAVGHGSAPLVSGGKPPNTAEVKEAKALAARPKQNAAES